MRKFHKILGLVLVLPFVGWAVTGVFFFIKPGYSEAYQSLKVKSYPISSRLPALTPSPDWQEIRWTESVIGLHLLVKKKDLWMQLNPVSFSEIKAPTEQSIRLLVNDAIKQDVARYGIIREVKGENIITSTDVTITIDWAQLKLRQRGADTDFIDKMYQIHYLQWTGVQSIDRVLGIIGLGAVLLLAILGLRMAFPRRRT
jgi:hypothetical protein